MGIGIVRGPITSIIYDSETGRFYTILDNLIESRMDYIIEQGYGVSNYLPYGITLTDGKYAYSRGYNTSKINVKYIGRTDYIEYTEPMVSLGKSKVILSNTLMENTDIDTLVINSFSNEYKGYICSECSIKKLVIKKFNMKKMYYNETGNKDLPKFKECNIESCNIEEIDVDNNGVKKVSRLNSRLINNSNIDNLKISKVKVDDHGFNVVEGEKSIIDGCTIHSVYLDRFVYNGGEVNDMLKIGLLSSCKIAKLSVNNMVTVAYGYAGARVIKNCYVKEISFTSVYISKVNYNCNYRALEDCAIDSMSMCQAYLEADYGDIDITLGAKINKFSIMELTIRSSRKYVVLDIGAIEMKNMLIEKIVGSIYLRLRNINKLYARKLNKHIKHIKCMNTDKYIIINLGELPEYCGLEDINGMVFVWDSYTYNNNEMVTRFTDKYNRENVGVYKIDNVNDIEALRKRVLALSGNKTNVFIVNEKFSKAMNYSDVLN